MAGMKKILFTEAYCQPEDLFPFTLTRQVQDIRVGILPSGKNGNCTLTFHRLTGRKVITRTWPLFSLDASSLGDDTCYLIHGNILPTEKLVRQVRKLKPGECISVADKESIVYCISAA
jgi:hypothetical protein